MAQNELVIPGDLLKKINNPEDLRKLGIEELPVLTQELREYIIDHVSLFGGHFGASLGVVELTVALHYALNTPYDQLVWDVGHQAYGHKILTGRRERFFSNRLLNGISGFPNRKESKYDAFGVGHSSTSISAALGMSIASRLKGELDKQHVAVIGDGAMTGGLAFEGMNHAGDTDNNMIIVLNDNCMSIDPNVGALKDYLTDITTSPIYNKVKEDVWKLLGKVDKIAPNLRQAASKVDHIIKSALLKHSNLFQALNLRYFGPVDGHDVTHLVEILNDMKKIPGPKLLHCITVKGKGFAPAELDQTKWHAPGKFDKLKGEVHKTPVNEPKPPKYQDVFGHTLVELADKNDKIVGITPAMPSGSSMNIMMKAYPERSFDVGIAEQHAVTFSAGLATQGLTAFCNIYSTFMQRAYDQVIHDVCLQNLPVIFCLDRAGFAGADGATHHGAYDLAYMRCVPNMVVAAPMNEHELRNLMYSAQLELKHPYTIRYPRGAGVMVDWKNNMELIPIGKGRVIQEGDKVAVLTIGHVGNYVVDNQKEWAKEGVTPGHYDMRFAKPLDTQLLDQIFEKYDHLVTIEDGCLTGGFGSAVLEYASEKGRANVSITRLGIPDTVVEQGTQLELQALCGFDPKGIYQTVLGLYTSSDVENEEVTGESMVLDL